MPRASMFLESGVSTITTSQSELLPDFFRVESHAWISSLSELCNSIIIIYYCIQQQNKLNVKSRKASNVLGCEQLGLQYDVSLICMFNPVTVQQGFGDTNIDHELAEICTPRILLFRPEFQCTDTQIKYKFYKTKSFMVLCCFTFFNLCLHFSIFVHTFLLFRSHREAAEII